MNPKNLRTLDKDTHPLYIRVNTVCPLILCKSNGDVLYGKNRGEKDDVLAQCNFDADLLIFPWVGEWSTDVFVLSKSDVDKHYDPR